MVGPDDFDRAGNLGLLLVDGVLAREVTVREFTRRVAPWPEIPAAIARRLMQRTHWLGFHLAVCGLRRVDERVLLVLWHFADRWGTMTPQGSVSTSGSPTRCSPR